MPAPTVTPERRWPYAPAPRAARPATPCAHPMAGMARLVRRAARQLTAAFDDRMLRDLDLGWGRTA